MTKGQILILLLIVVLVFYLTANKPNKPEPWEDNWKLVKKPKSIHPTKPSLPQSQIEKPYEPTEIKWPSDTPIIELPSATWANEPSVQPKPSNFGLNPPHSQVDEPWEPPKPPEPKPIIKQTLNCPAAEFIPDPENIQANEPSLNKSILTLEEQTQRKAQELSDYNWLLSNKTIADWQQEQKLTSPQFQILRHLVNEEEMNTLEHFLNLLPVNYEWLLLSSEFKTQPALIKHWKQHFTYHQTQDWLKIGLPPTDYALAAWLQNTKKLTVEEVLNFADLNQLKKEFTHGN